MKRKPKKPRRRSPEQDRSRALVAAIEEAAAHVLATHGYEGASTARIARKAGASVGSIYQYYGSKDAIYDAVAAKLLDDLLRAAGPVLLASGLTFEQRIERALLSGFEVVAPYPPLLRRLASVPGTAFEERLAAARGQAATFARTLLAAHADEIRLVDLDLAARVLLDATEGLIFNLKRDDDLARIAREGARLVARYCVA